jgi:hypothetical protein
MEESGRWQSQRGDEWWFEGDSISASGQFVPGSRALSIDSVRGVSSPDQLELLLLQTVRQFPDIEPRLLITAAMKPLIAELAARGTLTWVPLQHPFSLEARISWVTEPVPAATSE